MEQIVHSDKIVRPNLNEIVCNSLRKKIFSGELKQGEKILEGELSLELGVSKTPIKLSLIELSKEGLVELMPRKGTFVKEYTVDDIIDILEIRKVLDGLSALLAAENITDEQLEELNNLIDEHEKISKKYANNHRKEFLPDDFNLHYQIEIAFHTKIAESTHNRHLSEVIINNHIIVKSFLPIDSALYFQNYQTVRKNIKDHREILDALRSHNAKRAEEAAREHILYAISNIRNQYDEVKEVSE